MKRDIFACLEPPLCVRTGAATSRAARYELWLLPSTIMVSALIDGTYWIPSCYELNVAAPACTLKLNIR